MRRRSILFQRISLRRAEPEILVLRLRSRKPAMKSEDHQINQWTPYRQYRPQMRRVSPDKRPPLDPNTARDDLLLLLLSELRVATRQILGLFFPPDPAKTPKHLRGREPKRPGAHLESRLAKLFHHGHVYRRRIAYGGEMIYSLAPGGAERLKETEDRRISEPIDPLICLSPENGSYRVRMKPPALGTVQHELMVSRARGSLTAALRAFEGMSLDDPENPGSTITAPPIVIHDVRHDAPTTWKHDREMVTLRPDLFLILEDRGKPAAKAGSAFFFECDQSTMPLFRWNRNRVVGGMALKYVRYVHLYRDRQHVEAYKIPSFKVLTITKSAARAENLRRLVRTETWGNAKRTTSQPNPIPEDMRGMFLFATEESFKDQATNILAPIWKSAGDPDQTAKLHALARLRHSFLE